MQEPVSQDQRDKAPGRTRKAKGTEPTWRISSTRAALPLFITTHTYPRRRREHRPTRDSRRTSVLHDFSSHRDSLRAATSPHNVSSTHIVPPSPTNDLHPAGRQRKLTVGDMRHQTSRRTKRTRISAEFNEWNKIEVRKRIGVCGGHVLRTLGQRAELRRCRSRYRKTRATRRRDALGQRRARDRRGGESVTACETEGGRREAACARFRDWMRPTEVGRWDVALGKAGFGRRQQGRKRGERVHVARWRDASLSVRRYGVCTARRAGEGVLDARQNPSVFLQRGDGGDQYDASRARMNEGKGGRTCNLDSSKFAGVHTTQRTDPLQSAVTHRGLRDKCRSWGSQRSSGAYKIKLWIQDPAGLSNPALDYARQLNRSSFDIGGGCTRQLPLLPPD
ncbi:hypothetical protein K438DRAFT_1775638 [Mycena galopus ATCC 62051]|nr:hypothetical protein K438DRAFT_1775638 [Mycena galopus ATCC 62051]